MMRGIASTLEKHHRVQVLDEALEAAVRLSHRYIPARQLPDKAVSLLDTACARVAISQHAVRRRSRTAAGAIAALRDRAATIIGREDGDRRRRRPSARRPAEAELASAEREHAGGARGALARQERGAGRADPRAARRRAAKRGEAARARGRPDEAPARRTPDDACSPSCELQASCGAAGRAPLILPSVDEQAVASVVGDWTGIPVGRMVHERDRGGAEAGGHAATSGSSARTTRWR